MTMTDTELQERIDTASHAKSLDEAAKEEAKKYKFIDPMTIARRCFMTGKKFEIKVEAAGWHEYTEGETLRALSDCLPMLTEEETSLIVCSLSNAGSAELDIRLGGGSVDEDDDDECEAFD